MIRGSAATVSERSPPASCRRMIAPGRAPSTAESTIACDARPAVVAGIDRPQHHQHPVRCSSASVVAFHSPYGGRNRRGNFAP